MPYIPQGGPCPVGPGAGRLRAKSPQRSYPPLALQYRIGPVSALLSRGRASRARDELAAREGGAGGAPEPVWTY